MHELRRYRRLKIPLQVEIRHPAIGTLQVPAADMSDGGVFLLVDECFQLDLAESVIVRTLNLGPNGDDTGPPLVMTVVRKSHEGMGLSLETAASANLESLKAEHFNKHTILQSLFIIDDQSRVLLIKQEDIWHLPSRQLAGDESWPQGLQLLVENLKSDGQLEDNSSLRIQSSCHPNPQRALPLVELVVLAQLQFSGKSSSVSSQDFSPEVIPKTSSGHKWVPSTEIFELRPMLDPKLVDNILNQV